MPENEHERSVDVFPNEQSDGIKVQGKLDHHTAMLGGIVRVGKVVRAFDSSVTDDKKIPQVLVRIGGASEGSYISNWMPWTTTRAGYDGEWWAPETGEQVVVVAPSGNLAQGIIIGSLFRQGLTFDDKPGAPDDIEQRNPTLDATTLDSQIHKRIYKDGSSVTYDRNAHNLSMIVKSAPEAAEQTSATIVADKHIELSAGSTKITINQNGSVDIVAADNLITIVGNVKVTGTMDVSG